VATADLVAYLLGEPNTPTRAGLSSLLQRAGYRVELDPDGLVVCYRYDEARPEILVRGGWVGALVDALQRELQTYVHDNTRDSPYDDPLYGYPACVVPALQLDLPRPTETEMGVVIGRGELRSTPQRLADLLW
jgi:hypothetical protein